MSLPGVAEARAHMLARVTQTPAESVTLDAALGRVLREDLRATRDQPPFAASAMDGWVVRDADVHDAPADLLIVGESAAGRGFDGVLGSGEAVRISTGAPLPDGADRVVMQEETTRSGERVSIGPQRGTSRFVRPRAADFAAGDLLLAAGARLDPWRLALAASAGVSALRVGARPRVAVVPTGDEVAAPGTSPSLWQIFDAAGAGLAAWFRARGCDAVRRDALPDDRAAVTAAVTAALADLDCDLLVTIGGASVGDHDLVKPALRDIGLEMVVEGVAVRPGKPVWFGVLPGADAGRSRLVLGLPGNPVSAMVCAELFATAIVAAIQGATPETPLVRARLASPLPANGPREHYLRATIRPADDGGLTAEAAPDQDSSLVSVLASAGGLIRRLPGAAAAGTGETVEVLRLDRAEAVG